MKQAIIVQAMREKTYEQIVETRGKAIKVLRDGGNAIMNSAIADEGAFTNIGENVNKPLREAANLLSLMSMCAVVYFCVGWEYEPKCRTAHEAALSYGLEIIYEQLEGDKGESV